MSGPLLLVVLDGFGIGDGGAADSTAVAHTSFFDRARRDYPMAQLETSGEAVGLPPGQMGNSEVGHMTMGAGRVIEQDMTRIARALESGELDTNSAVQQALAAIEKSGGTLHLMRFSHRLEPANLPALGGEAIRRDVHLPRVPGRAPRRVRADDARAR